MKLTMMTRLLISVAMAFGALSWTITATAGEIHDAAFTGDLAKVKALLEANPQCGNEKDEQGLTPLLWARDAAVVELLLNHKADVNVSNKDGATPLLLAAENSHAAVVELLLKHKADVNAANTYGSTPLHFAALKGSITVAELLLNYQADVNAKNRAGDTPLHYATNAELNALLKKNGATDEPLPGSLPVKRLDKEQMESFLNAIDAGNAEEVEKLLKAIPTLANAVQDPPFRWSVLHEASSEGRTEIVQLLLAHDANPNATNKDGETPLHWAVRKGHAEIVKLLLDHKANPNAADEKQHTPLHEAAFHGQKEIAELLLAAKANVNARDKAGKTPLFYAHDNGYKEISDLLRKRGAKE